jgi:aminoglycoside N3'-acetyltransferase
MSVTRTDILESIRRSDLSAGIVCLHSSLKAFGFVEGGAEAVIDAFLDAGCTLIVPTFTYECEGPPPAGRMVERNGDKRTWSVGWGEVAAFDPDGGCTAGEMGAIPAGVLERPGRIRGGHPLGSFTGLGSRAAECIAAQAPLNVYAPLKAMYADPRAFLVLAGVGLNRATAIHFAEERTGRRLFRRWGKAAGGTVVEGEVGGCSEGFENLAPALRAVEKQMTVGAALWRIFRFNHFVDAAAAAIAVDPAITHCSDPQCARCNDAVRGGPLV